MASKKTITKKAVPAKKAPAKKAAPKKPAGEKQAAKPQGPRHPRGRVSELHKGKEELAKALAPALVTESEDEGTLTEKLKTASNTQLLRLHKVVQAVKDKWGSREALITAIGTATNKSKDKDYLAKLAKFSLPRLYDLATSATRRARA
jgi:hypothetical protein